MSKIISFLPPMETLRDVFSIDPETGRLTWRIAGQKRVVGAEAGYVNNIGYRQVMLGRKIHSVHRIAWALYHGGHPNGEVDHINSDRSDNRLCNLRLATSAQNNQNRRLSSRNKTGIKGVFKVKWAKSWRWRVSVGHSSEYEIEHFVCLGRAAMRANMLRQTLHGEFANAGVPA